MSTDTPSQKWMWISSTSTTIAVPELAAMRNTKPNPMKRRIVE